MFLVSTADETTWDTSKQICFLGEWCRRYSRRNSWKNLNAYVLPYHWDDRTKYNSDYYYLDGVYEDCLAQLSDELNRINCVSNGIDYWRIVVGPWLRFFIDALFDRFEIIRSAGDSGVVSNTWILPYKLSDWVANGFSDFYTSLNDDRWNHVIFAECIRAIGLPHGEVPNDVVVEPAVHASNLYGKKKKLMRSILEAYQKCIPSWLNRHVLISPYLSFGHAARLQIGLGQLPYLLAPSLTLRDINVDKDIRAAISLNLGVKRFELLLEKLIPFLLPKVYLENYDFLCKTALAAYPKRPSTIFTANAYQADDGFKFWVAEKRKNGTPLVIGQHGGNMGIAHHNQTEDHQVKIADSFCTWGWRQSGIDSICPLPSLQLSQQDNLTHSANGDILLIFASIPRYFYCHFSMPIAGQFLDYLNDQILLVSMVKPLARSLIRIRLNGDEYGWDIVARLRDAGLGEMIDKSSYRLEARVSKCRLCIVSYNATVILQTLEANFPTIAFWDPDLFDIRPDATPLVNRLREVGILHDTVDSAAQLINEIYDDVQRWWQRQEVQEARAAFCYLYAKTSNTWIKDWADHLDSVKLK
jgi:putative transferase (TIGR04331 family)